MIIISLFLGEFNYVTDVNKNDKDSKKDNSRG